MASEPPAQKKRRLPFKPPSRAPSAGPSTTASKSKNKTNKTNKTTKTTKTTKASAKSSSAASSSKTAARSESTTKRPRAQSPPKSVASDSGSESSVHSRQRSISQEPDYILAEIMTNHPTEDVASSDPTIPPKLLTRLLHQNFSSDKTKVAKDANPVVAKYVDVFVREAIARAAYERTTTNSHGGRGASDGFLEVEDLEKMAPQLTMDF